MEYFRPLILGGMLFILTVLLCIAAVNLILFNPIYGILFFLFGSLGVVLTVDAIQAAFLS